MQAVVSTPAPTAVAASKTKPFARRRKITGGELAAQQCHTSPGCALARPLLGYRQRAQASHQPDFQQFGMANAGRPFSCAGTRHTPPQKLFFMAWRC